MSIYPVQVTKADLYTAHTDRRYPLGAIGTLKVDEGHVYARYMQNKIGASKAAGHWVNYGSSWGVFESDAVGDTHHNKHIAGVMCASATTDGYAWVAFQGPVTNAQLAATLASSASTRGLTIDANGRLATGASTLTNQVTNARSLAILSDTAATVDSGDSSDGTVMILWR
jgi:hypothetical protein